MSIIRIALILDVLFGLIQNFFLGDFYGDAAGFKRYSTEGATIFRSYDIYYSSVLNTIFVTYIYSFLGRFSPIIVNSGFIYFFWSSLKSTKIFDKSFYKKEIVLKKYNLICLLYFILIFSPSIYLRFAEPSREFLGLLLSLLLGSLFGSKNSNFLRFLTFLILILTRPVYLFLYISFIGISYIITYSGFSLTWGKIAFGFIFVFIINFLSSRLSFFTDSLILTKDINRLYSDLSDLYGGSNNNNIFRIMFFKIFGGLNSFLKATSSFNTRLFFFIDYINRLIIYLLSYRLFRNNFIFFIIFATLLVSLAAGYPHHRYLQPSYYFVCGYFSVYYLNKLKNLDKT